MRKIKILVASLSRDFGGVESLFLNLCKNISDKIVFDFLCWDSKAAKKDEFLGTGANIIMLDRPGKSLYKYATSLNKILKKNYDIYHVNLTRYRFPLDLLMAKLSGLKIVIHTHSTQVYKSKSLKTNIIRQIEHKIFKGITLSLSDCNIACSRESAKFFFGNKKSCIIYNGIDTEKFGYSPESRRKIREELGITDDTILLGHVGRFSNEKNHKMLIELMAKLKKENENYKLICIGDGDLHNQIKDYTYRLGLKNDIFFTGIRSDINRLLSAIDVFLLPSYHEAYPVVLVEAQANGLPCIVSDTVSREINRTGKLFFKSINNTEEWIHLLHDREACARYIPDKQELWQLDVNYMEKKLIDVYSSLIR